MSRVEQPTDSGNPSSVWEMGREVHPRWRTTPDWLAEAYHNYAAIVPMIAATAGQCCVYCHAPARCLDHIVPTPVSGKTWRPRVPVVPACLSCNSTLHAFPSSDIYERRRIIAYRRAKRAYKELTR